MAGLPEVIGLLHRADWTRLSLSAEVRFEQDGDLARRRQTAVRTEAMRRIGIRLGPDGWPSAKQEPEDERGGYHRWRAALLIAPGRRYRLEYEGDYGDRADGSDGEQGWTLRPPARRRFRRATSRAARGCRFRPCSARPACSPGSPWTWAGRSPPAAATRSP